jgi:Tfp pilus assembly protein PilV
VSKKLTKARESVKTYVPTREETTKAVLHDLLVAQKWIQAAEMMASGSGSLPDLAETERNIWAAHGAIKRAMDKLARFSTYHGESAKRVQ